MSEPQQGQWVVWRNWRINKAKIAKVTPKLLKFGGEHPRQLAREGGGILAIVDSEEQAAALIDPIAGADGEFRRRECIARDAFNAALRSAVEARDKQVARIIAERAKGGDQ